MKNKCKTDNPKAILPFATAVNRFSGPKLAWAMEALASHGPEATEFGIEESQHNTYLVNLESRVRLSQFHPATSPGQQSALTRAIGVRRSLATKRKGKAP